MAWTVVTVESAWDQSFCISPPQWNMTFNASDLSHHFCSFFFFAIVRENVDLVSK